jgi:raffinose/stachyose/melibiose transport system permease protein
MIGQYTTKWGPVGAGLAVATLPTIIIYIIMSSEVQRNLIAGAVKG